MTISELEEMFAQEPAQESQEVTNVEDEDEDTDVEVEVAEIAESNLKAYGIVSAAAKKFINDDSSLPMVQFSMSMDKPVEDFGELNVQVQGTGLVEFAAMRFTQGVRVVAEGYTYVLIDGDSETLWMDASMIGAVGEL